MAPCSRMWRNGLGLRDGGWLGGDAGRDRGWWGNLCIGSRSFSGVGDVGAGRVETALATGMADLDRVLRVLRQHRLELEALGVRHAAVFGSVSRGEATANSDIDILLDIEPMGLFAYSGLKLHVANLFEGRVDVVNRTTLKPLLKDEILREAVSAF